MRQPGEGGENFYRKCSPPFPQTPIPPLSKIFDFIESLSVILAARGLVFLEAESISGRASSKKAVAEYRIREFGREERLGGRLRSSLLRFYDNGMFLTPKDTRKAGTSSCWRDSGLHWTTLGSKFFEWWGGGTRNIFIILCLFLFYSMFVPSFTPNFTPIVIAC